MSLYIKENGHTEYSAHIQEEAQEHNTIMYEHSLSDHKLLLYVIDCLSMVRLLYHIILKSKAYAASPQMHVQVCTTGKHTFSNIPCLI